MAAAGTGIEDGRRRVTLAEIAREAGVSVGLVSTLLSGRAIAGVAGSGIRIGAGTAARVVETCRRLQYQPERAGTFRMIYPELAPIALVGSVHDRFQTNRYHSMILDGVVGRATALSVSLNVFQYDPGIDYGARPEGLPDWVSAGDVHRFIFAGPPNPGLLRLLAQRGGHVVYASRDPGVDGVSVVVPDYAQAGEVAMRYLFNLGHRRVGLFGLPYFHGTYQARELLRGVDRALADHGLAQRLFLEPAAAGDAAATPGHALDTFLGAAEPVTAVFAFDDLSAESLIRAANLRGLRIPGDFSLVGCNDERQAALVHPPLTTIHLPVTEIGQRCVDLLHELAAGPAGQPARAIVLPVHLVERASARRV